MFYNILLALKKKKRKKLTSHSDAPPSAGTGGSTEDLHKNEGFLKSAWHRFTNQHKSSEPKPTDASKKDTPKKDNDDHHNGPKNASESG
jgi:molecular chaperone DnaJ